MSIKYGFLVGTSSPPPVASALALVFREVENTELSQPFAFSAETHLDIAKSPGILRIFAKVGSIVR